MKLCGWFYFAILTLPAVGSSIVDISLESQVRVHTGDTLLFHAFTGNYGLQAAARDLPGIPSGLSFALATRLQESEGSFAATLESEDRSLSVAFGNLSFTPGAFQGSGYAGEVSTLQGFLHLAPPLSEALFREPSALIALLNQGPDVTLGLEPYALRQSLFVTVSGGALSVGATPVGVELESQILSRFNSFEGFPVRPVSLVAGPDVPEPGSGALLLTGGIILCGLSAALAHLPRRRG